MIEGSGAVPDCAVVKPFEIVPTTSPVAVDEAIPIIPLIRLVGLVVAYPS